MPTHISVRCIFAYIVESKFRLTYPCTSNRKSQSQKDHLVEIHAKRAQKPEMLQMHEYYTSNPLKLQGFLSIFTIFVDYADFLCQHDYVNRYNHFNMKKCV